MVALDTLLSLISMEHYALQIQNALSEGGFPQCPEKHTFLAGEGVEDLQHTIAADVALYPIDTVGLIDYYRPLMQRQVLKRHGDPSEDAEPARYFDAMRITEESLRQGILRSIGDMAVSTLAMWSIDNFAQDKRNLLGDWRNFKEMSRGRVYSQQDAALVDEVDRQVRRICESVLVPFAFDRCRAESAFEDTSLRVRDLASRTLDLRLGEGWRSLDWEAITRLEPLELDGKPLSRYDRHLLLKTRKPAQLHTSLGNSMSTAAEFAVSSIIDVEHTLFSAGYSQDALFPILFANINKLTLGAALPFWPAHKLSQNTKVKYSNNIFRAIPKATSLGVLAFNDEWHRNYYARGILGTCQGMRPSKDPIVVNDPKRQQRLGHLLEIMLDIAVIEGSPLPLDIPNYQLRPPNLTSVQVSTILAFSVAYADIAYKK